MQAVLHNGSMQQIPETGRWFAHMWVFQFTESARDGIIKIKAEMPAGDRIRTSQQKQFSG